MLATKWLPTGSDTPTNTIGMVPVSPSSAALLRPRREWPRSRAAEQRDERATLQLTELHLVPTSPGQIARYRIGEDQSGGNGTILQPVSRWRGRPMSEVGQERQWPSEQGDGGCPLYYSNCGHDGAPRRDAISIKPLMRLFRLTTASAY